MNSLSFNLLSAFSNFQRNLLFKVNIFCITKFAFKIFYSLFGKSVSSICLFGQVNIKSLEDVVRAYLKLAEEKTEAAKEESQQMVLDIEDLDNIQTPERYVG